MSITQDEILRVDSILKENKKLKANWAELEVWLSPDRCKPLYWDYMTAKCVMARMENITEEVDEDD